MIYSEILWEFGLNWIQEREDSKKKKTVAICSIITLLHFVDLVICIWFLIEIKNYSISIVFVFNLNLFRIIINSKGAVLVAVCSIG